MPFPKNVSFCSIIWSNLALNYVFYSHLLFELYTTIICILFEALNVTSSNIIFAHPLSLLCSGGGARDGSEPKDFFFQNGVQLIFFCNLQITKDLKFYKKMALVDSFQAYGSRIRSVHDLSPTSTDVKVVGSTKTLTPKKGGSSKKITWKRGIFASFNASVEVRKNKYALYAYIYTLCKDVLSIFNFFKGGEWKFQLRKMGGSSKILIRKRGPW